MMERWTRKYGRVTVKQTEEDVERTELESCLRTIPLFWNKWTEYELYNNGSTL